MTIRGNVLTLRCLIGPWKLNRGTTFRRSLTTTLEAIAPPSEEEVCRLVEFFNGKSCVVTISGAGISTASGIPDYRGPNGSYRKGHVPIKHQEFLRSEAVRKRYWLRSMYGWPRLARAKPNLAHVAVSRLEGAGIVESVVTQNVDRLHQLSGSTQVVDLHGRIDQVICMDCQIRFSRR